MKIKNITVVNDEGQEFSFTSKSLVEVAPYDASKDPEVQGKGLADITPEVPSAPVEAPEQPEIAPTDVPATETVSEPVAEPAVAPTEPMVEPVISPTE